MIATVTLNPSLDEWVQLPRLLPGRLNRATGFRRDPGGKGLNVSRVVHTLGGKTAALTFLGGEDGHVLRALVERLGIPLHAVSIAGTTRNNYKLRTARPLATTEINTTGPRVSAENLRQLQRRLFACRPAPRCVVLSGSLPPGVPAQIYARWIRRLRRAGLWSVLDASGEAMRQGVAARPWLVKPNLEEAEELLGRPITHRGLVAAVRRLAALGPEIVLLSLGQDGAVLGTARETSVWWAKAPVIRPQGAVGAGDAMVGGFVLGWLRSGNLRAAMRLGVACGTATAMAPGTQLARRADVYRLLPRVAIRKIA